MMMTLYAKPISIGIVGANGRMGRMIIQSVLDNPNIILKACFARDDSSLLGVDAGVLIGAGSCGTALSVLNHDSPRVDVLIDFSLPNALDDVLAYCTKHKTALVMGVTGFDEEQEAKLKQASDIIPIVYAGNYSTGVNLSLNLIATTAKVLGLDADVEIIEKHHKHKLDAPSGTAFMMAKAVADARLQELDQVMTNGREGASKRQSGEIGIHAIRGGEIVGEHIVQFITGGEIIEITHKAQSRATFADGAVRAGIWLHDKAPKLYDMQDVLGLKHS